MTTTMEIQTRLKSLGIDPGPVDGFRGRATRRAVMAFQALHGLAPDGIAGPLTRAKLFPEHGGARPDIRMDLPWYEEARRLMGTQERAGRANNERILAWARELDIAYAGDDIPWCGLFVAHCLSVTMPDEILPAGLLSARSWRRFGQPCEPTLGCVLVFWREDRHGSKGHVGFYAGEDETSFGVLGGNQSDAVGLARIAKARLLEARFPRGMPLERRRGALVEAAPQVLSADEA